MTDFRDARRNLATMSQQDRVRWRRRRDRLDGGGSGATSGPGIDPADWDGVSSFNSGLFTFHDQEFIYTGNNSVRFGMNLYNATAGDNLIYTEDPNNGNSVAQVDTVADPQMYAPSLVGQSWSFRRLSTRSDLSDSEGGRQIVATPGILVADEDLGVWQDGDQPANIWFYIGRPGGGTTWKNISTYQFAYTADTDTVVAQAEITLTYIRP